MRSNRWLIASLSSLPRQKSEQRGHHPAGHCEGKAGDWGDCCGGAGKVSDDGKKVPMEVKVGDKVLYGKYSGTEVTYEGDEYLIMREADIFAIV